MSSKIKNENAPVKRRQRSVDLWIGMEQLDRPQSRPWSWMSICLLFLISLNLATGVCNVLMASYMLLMSPMYDTYGVREVDYLFVLQAVLGGLVFWTATLGLFYFDVRNSGYMKTLATTFILIGGIQLVFGSYLLHAGSDPVAHLCQLSNNDYSPECKIFRSSAAWKTSYYIWRQVWLKASEIYGDDQAGDLIESIQDNGKCCGFGIKMGCSKEKNANMISTFFESIPWNTVQTCAVSDPNEYCIHTFMNKTYVSNCSEGVPWDFPFDGVAQGNTGRCLVENMKLGKGCDIYWTEYLFEETRSLGFLWIILSLIQLLCPLALFCCLCRRTKLQVSPINQKQLLPENESLLSPKRAKA